MSERRCTIFPLHTTDTFPPENELKNLLLEKGVVVIDHNRPKEGLILGADFLTLLNNKGTDLEPTDELIVWLEYFEDISIQIGADSQNLEYIKTPDTKERFGDLDLAYELIGELSDDIGAEYTHTSGQIYKIRSLDFSHYMGYGHSFIHIDAYIPPTQAFLIKLSDIVGFPLGYCMFWL